MVIAGWVIGDVYFVGGGLVLVWVIGCFMGGFG